MKIIFMGTPELARVSLEKINNSKHEILAVVTQPDRQSGRGQKVSFSPVKEYAVQNNLKVLQYENISDESALNELKGFGADIFVVVAYAQKLSDSLLEMAPYGCINEHPSLLPRHRGSSPLRGAILYGDEKTGVTIMQLSSEWDAGDILLQKEIVLDKKETIITLEDKVRPLGAQMIIEVLDGLEKGTIKPVPQDNSKANYIKQIKKEEGLIDFSKSAEEIERQIRACIPWPSAFTYLDNKVLKIFDADVLTAQDFPNANDESFNPAEVAFSDKNTLIVSCKEGFLKLNEIQIEGKKRMQVSDFLRGRKIEKGTVFGK